MIIVSELTTLDDINKIEDDKNEDYLGLEATIDIYKEILKETINGKKTIDELIHKFNYDNMYLLKISFFFPDEKCNTYYTINKKHIKGYLYYVFYSDQTPDAGVHGFITNNDYIILTIPDEFIFDKDNNNLDNTNIYEDYLCDNTTETDKIFINKILKYFHSHYKKNIINKNEDEVLINTNEYWKIFTLVNNNEKNINDKRIDNLINTLVCYDFLKDIDYKNEKKLIINNEEFIFSFNKQEKNFSFGWYDNKYESKSTEFLYTFKMNHNKINLINQYISDNHKDFDIKYIYEELWNKVINKYIMKDWLNIFFNEIEKYIN